MELINHLPLRLQTTEIGLFQQAVSPLSEALEAAREDFILQLDPTTATWGLANWEQTLGITTDATKDDEYRRTAVVAALRGTGTSTVAAIQNVAESFSNGEVAIVEYPSEYRFEIHFTSTLGIPPNMDDLTTAIEAMKPAHLAYAYVIQYRTWAMLSGVKWGDVADYTWTDLREGSITT